MLIFSSFSTKMQWVHFLVLQFVDSLSRGMQIQLKHINFTRRFEGSSSHLPLFATTQEGRAEGYNDDNNNNWSGGQRGRGKRDSSIGVFLTQGQELRRPITLCVVGTILNSLSKSVNVSLNILFYFVKIVISVKNHDFTQ